MLKDTIKRKKKEKMRDWGKILNVDERQKVNIPNIKRISRIFLKTHIAQ